MLVSFLEFAVNFVTSTIKSGGYISVFLLMVLESALIPVPSEIIMPFSGFLVSDGHFDFWSVVLAGTLGNLIGSLLAYYVGLKLGYSFLRKYGRLLMIKMSHVRHAEKFFHKYGEASVFFSRLMPIVRTFISLPAGMFRVNMKKFIIYTFFGSLPWCFILTYIGVILRENWAKVLDYIHRLELALLIVLFVLFLHFTYRKRKPATYSLG